MKIFRYKQDRVPTAIFFAYFALDLLVFFYAESVWFLVLWLLIGIIPKTCICAWNHHHQHVPTFHHGVLNRILELVFGFQTGLCGNAWVLHHVVGHHRNYLDQDLDESRWKRPDGSVMGREEYSFDVFATSYWRAWRAGQNFPKHVPMFVVMATAQLALLVLFFLINWVNALFVFLIPMLISVYMTARATYEHHAGLDTDDHLEASYNVIDKWYNILLGNLGYHTAHHMKAGLHWSKLPEYHKEIEAGIPPHLYKNAGFPFTVITKIASLFEPKGAEAKG